jgi:hypothetical protein
MSMLSCYKKRGGVRGGAMGVATSSTRVFKAPSQIKTTG